MQTHGSHLSIFEPIALLRVRSFMTDQDTQQQDNQPKYTEQIGPTPDQHFSRGRAVRLVIITAKDFRTWNACTLFLDEAMEQTRCCENPKELKLKPILKSVSSRLGNTPAILQKSYVHPELVDLYRTGCFLNKEWQHGKKDVVPAGYRKTEALLLRWLQKRYA